MLAACPLMSWEARMSRFVELAIALLVLGICVPATPVQAATLCRTPADKDALALLAQQQGQAPDLLADCVEKCTPAAQRDLAPLAAGIQRRRSGVPARRDLRDREQPARGPSGTRVLPADALDPR
jgi:hypothetical protein